MFVSHRCDQDESWSGGMFMVDRHVGGWQTQSGKHIVPANQLSCHICQRRRGLWLGGREKVGDDGTSD